MKILFDQNVPRPLARFLTKHNVITSPELGWQELRNGELLKAAEEQGFDVLVTADRNLSYQQNLDERRLPIVVLPSGQWPLLQIRLPEIVQAVDDATPGCFREIAPARPAKIQQHES